MVDVAELVAGLDAPIVIANRGAVRMVVLNRPSARNALTRQMRADLGVLLEQADRDSAVGAIILAGSGGAFSAGVDLKDRIEGAPPVEPNPGAALRGLAKPVIAAIDGVCVTGGLEMALSCAFAIATPEARFADTHCKIGFFPRWGGGSLLASVAGVRRARQMMLTGGFIDAVTARDWGLVNELVTRESLLDRAISLAEAMVAQAQAHPLSYKLHAAMLDEIGATGTASDIEARSLARFDRERSQRTLGHAS